MSAPIQERGEHACQIFAILGLVQQIFIECLLYGKWCEKCRVFCCCFVMFLFEIKET